eukprot:jgi/Chrzof1/13089/Cz07g19120.t1
MQRSGARFLALAAQRLRAPLPASGSKKQKQRGPARVDELSRDVVKGVAIRKGEAEPAILADSEYPEWLWSIHEPPPTLGELQRLYQSEGLTPQQVGMIKASCCAASCVLCDNCCANKPC